MNRTVDRRANWISRLLLIFSLIFLAFGLFNLSWTLWPTHINTVQFNIPAGVLPGAPAETTFASLAEYSLTVTWPMRLRAGETGLLRVTLAQVGPEDTPPVVDQPAQIVLVEPSILNLPLTPTGRVQANLAEDQELALTWEVEAVMTGEHPGKVIVSFGFYDESLAALVPVPVAVVDVSLRVIGLWGLDTGLAMWFGVVSLALWGAFFVLSRTWRRA